jgi:hypothetical protein
MPWKSRDAFSVAFMVLESRITGEQLLERHEKFIDLYDRIPTKTEGLYGPKMNFSNAQARGIIEPTIDYIIQTRLFESTLHRPVSA